MIRTHVTTSVSICLGLIGSALIALYPLAGWIVLFGASLTLIATLVLSVTDGNWPLPRTISLKKAAQIAYDQLQNDLTGEVARRLGTEDPGDWFATAFTKDGDVRVFGLRPGALTHVRIPAAELKNGGLRGGGAELWEQGTDQAAFTDLRILRSDFKRKLRAIQSWTFQ